MIGEIVGCYRLMQKLGEGSMGEVFLGQHTLSGEQAAVKVLFPPFSKQGMALSRYFAELRSTNALGYSGIVKIYDCGAHTSGRAFVCMEFLAGRSLAAALVDLPIGDLATMIAIGTQVATCLEAVHGRRMIHRALVGVAEAVELAIAHRGGVDDEIEHAARLRRRESRTVARGQRGAGREGSRQEPRRRPGSAP